MDTIFKKINDLKSIIKERLLSNQNLLKMIVYNEGNPFDLPDIDDPQSLLNNYIYLNPVVWDSTIQEVRTFLLTNFRVAPNRVNTAFADVYLYFYVISHNDIYSLENGDTRVISICDELMKSFDSSYGNWVGKCCMNGFQEITSRKDYYAIELQFKFSDFKGKIG